MVYLTEFASERGVKASAVSMYIRRHSESFEGHVGVEDGKTVLDAAAEQMLAEKYPYRIVEKEVDTESRELYLAALEKLTRVQDERDELRKLLADQTKQIATAEMQTFLLEQKDDRIRHLEEELEEQRRSSDADVTRVMLMEAQHKTALDEARQEADVMRRKADRAEDRMLAAERELEERKTWGLLRRLLNK